MSGTGPYPPPRGNPSAQPGPGPASPPPPGWVAPGPPGAEPAAGGDQPTAPPAAGHPHPGPHPDPQPAAQSGHWAAPGHQPPPGAVVPPGGPPEATPPGRSAIPPGTPRGMLGAAHKPGAIPLRPLTLGDIYDAAFRIIRYNPKATVGSAVLVSAVAMALPILATGLFAYALGLSIDPASGITDPTTEFSGEQIAGLVATGAAWLLGALLQGLGLVLVTGMVAHVTAAAATGRKLGLGRAWALTHGKRWRLIGLALLLVTLALLLVGGYALILFAIITNSSGTGTAVVSVLVSLPLFGALMCWFWIRVYYLAVPPLILEPGGVVAAIGRGFSLTRGQFWRTFGIALLTVVITTLAGYMLSLPFTLVGQGVTMTAGSADSALMALVVSNALGTVLTTAFVAPFSATVASLQYLDLRIRKEAYDVELLSIAGLAGR